MLFSHNKQHLALQFQPSLLRMVKQIQKWPWQFASTLYGHVMMRIFQTRSVQRKREHMIYFGVSINGLLDVSIHTRRIRVDDREIYRFHGQVKVHHSKHSIFLLRLSRRPVRRNTRHVVADRTRLSERFHHTLHNMFTCMNYSTCTACISLNQMSHVSSR